MKWRQSHGESLAYLAGIVDGEGSIYMQHGYDKKRSGKSVWTRIGIAVQMKCEYIPKLFLFQFGGTVRHDKKNGMWRWHAYANVALCTLNTLLPYLTIKKPQAELAIKVQSRIRKRLYSGRGHRVPDKEIALRQAEAILLHKMKKEVA